MSSPPTTARVLKATFRDLLAWARSRPRWAALAGLLLALAFAYAAWRGPRRSSDLFVGYLEPTRGIVFEGGTLADFSFNSFPPFFYVVMAPFAALPWWVASALWSLLMVALGLGVVALVHALVEAAAPTAPRLPKWVGPALATTLLLDNLFLGQSNVFALFFLCAAAWELASGREVRSGLLLSVAVAFKVTPAVFGLVYLLRGRWRALVALGAGVVLCLGVVPAVALGPSRGPALVVEWSQMVLEPYLRGGQVQSRNISWYHTNQSLEAALNRSLTPYGREQYGGLHEFVDPGFLDEAQVHRVATGLRALLVAALALVVWRGRRDPRHLVHAFALIPGAMLWLSPASWYSHYVAMLVPYIVAAHAVKAGDQDARWLRAGLVVAVGLTSVSLDPTLRSYSLPFFGQLLLYGVLLKRAWRLAATPA